MTDDTKQDKRCTHGPMCQWCKPIGPMTDDTKRDERCKCGHDRGHHFDQMCVRCECVGYRSPLRDATTNATADRCGIADCEGDHLPQDHNDAVRNTTPYPKACRCGSGLLRELCCNTGAIDEQLAALRAENESLRARDTELWREAQGKIDTLKQRLRGVRAERDRLLTANGKLEAVIEDTYKKRDGDTCGRVQCRNTANALRAERDERIAELEAEVERMQRVVDAAKDEAKNGAAGMDLEAAVDALGKKDA